MVRRLSRPLTEQGSYRLVLVDERACGRSDRTAPRETWTLERMAQDVSDLAASLGVRDRYATLGHSYGAFLVEQDGFLTTVRRFLDRITS